MEPKNIYIFISKNIFRQTWGIIYLFLNEIIMWGVILNFKDKESLDKFLIFQMVLVIIGLLYVLYKLFSSNNYMFMIFPLLSYLALIIYASYGFKDNSDTFFKITLYLLIISNLVNIMFVVFSIGNNSFTSVLITAVTSIITIGALLYSVFNLNKPSKTRIVLLIPILIAIIDFVLILLSTSSALALTYVILYVTVGLIYNLRVYKGFY